MKAEAGIAGRSDERIRRRLHTSLVRIDLRRTSSLLFASAALIGVIGAIVYLGDPQDPWLGLDSELGLRWPQGGSTVALPAIWSAILLVGAGLTWLAAAVTTEWRRSTRVLMTLFGVALMYLAVDELFIIHERLEARLLIDWQVLYAPVMAVLALLIAGLVVRAARVDRRAGTMLVAGTICWAVAQILEYVQWDGDQEVTLYGLFMIPEEVLEMCGSILFGLAAVRLLQARAEGRRPAGGDAHGGP